MDATGKAILSYVVGKRNAENTRDFLADLRTRVINRPNISSDAFTQYPEAIELAFGADVDYGQFQKCYSEDANEPRRSANAPPSRFSMFVKLSPAASPPEAVPAPRRTSTPADEAA